MRYAFNSLGLPFEVEQFGDDGGEFMVCPGCKTEVYARTSATAVSHWVHKSRGDCCECYEPMTQWHKDWQDRFPLETREKVVGKNRADVLINNFVIEFQHSSLSGPKIKQRESAYKNMAWVIDAREHVKSDPDIKSKERQRVDICFESTFIDRYRVLCKCAVFIDLGFGCIGHVIYVSKPRPSRQVATVRLYSIAEFITLASSDWIKTAKGIYREDKKAAKSDRSKGNWGEGELGVLCPNARDALLPKLKEQSVLKLASREILSSIQCLHLPPFDAVESPDQNRLGWIRSDCRKCGRFIGCRPTKSSSHG